LIVVIQCAAKKNKAAGYLRDSQGRVLEFVAHPEFAPRSEDRVYFRPDDSYGRGTWREYLKKYNESGSNPYGLLPAIELYDRPAYGALANAFPADRLFVLSAGWGLVSARFLLPHYDITFNGAAPRYKRRLVKDVYADFQMLTSSDEPIVFCGSKAYVPLFCRLISHLKQRKAAFFKTAEAPKAPGCHLIPYKSKTRNWHYEVAHKLASSDPALLRAIVGV
jgi:hypothetical protein